MNSGKDKKLTVMTKNLHNKKPTLEIDTNQDHESAAKTQPFSSPSLNVEEGNAKGITAFTSPSNAKIAMNSNNEVHEGEAGSHKKQPMQKKISHKEPLTTPTKVELQPKMASNFSTNAFLSPKANLNKDKMLTSFPSEKNLASGIRFQKRETNLPRDSKAIRIDELEKIVEESKIKQSQLSAKQSELELGMSKLDSQLVRIRAENLELLAQNTELKKKIEKYKISNEETKKMLKQRIHSFNEESGEMQALRNQMRTLEERVQSLLEENQTLKAEINKFSDYNLKDLSNIQALGSNALVTSNVREVQLQGSRVSQLYLKESNERDLLEFTNMQNMQENLALQSYITEQEESYIEEYKTNVDIFDKIKLQYEHILEDIEIRYKTLSKDYQKAAQEQAAQIYELQNRIDDLVHEQKEGKRQQANLSLSLDEMVLRNQKEIAALNLSVYDLRDANKQLLEDISHHRAQCRFLQAELDIQRMKKKFKNENDKFEYNVVKLNLLNIIDKLKMQIDKEKSRYNKIYERYKCLGVRRN